MRSPEIRAYKLLDVAEGKVSMETFIAQLSKEDLACIIRGDGNGKPQGDAGNGSGFRGRFGKLKGLRDSLRVL